MFKLLLKSLKYWEKYYPMIISIIICIVGGRMQNSEWGKSVNEIIYNGSFVGTIITIEGILFAFLLTVLTLTIQSTSINIEIIKRADRFKELIRYNKKAVFYTLFSVMMSLCVYITILVDDCFMIFIRNNIWCYLVSYSILSSYRYTSLFFKIVLDE